MVFQEQVRHWVISNGYECLLEMVHESPFMILRVSSSIGKQIKIQLIDLETWQLKKKQLPLSFFSEITDLYRNGTIHFVNLWEDVWISKATQVQERLASVIGSNATLPGRLTESRMIDKQLAIDFIEQWHVNGVVNSVYQVGLFLPQRRWHYLPKKVQEQFQAPQELLVAVATFGRLRKMKHIKEGYLSGEMVRLATFGGVTITGGLSKLLKKFHAHHPTDDMMTYADRDWSDGDSYVQTGFEHKGDKESFKFVIDLATYQRNKWEESYDLLGDQYLVGWNAGSRKWVKKYE